MLLIQVNLFKFQSWYNDNIKKQITVEFLFMNISINMNIGIDRSLILNFNVYLIFNNNNNNVNTFLKLFLIHRCNIMIMSCTLYRNYLVGNSCIVV